LFMAQSLYATLPTSYEIVDSGYALVPNASNLLCFVLRLPITSFDFFARFPLFLLCRNITPGPYSFASPSHLKEKLYSWVPTDISTCLTIIRSYVHSFLSYEFAF
jgi:hypothetical protein